MTGLDCGGETGGVDQSFLFQTTQVQLSATLTVKTSGEFLIITYKYFIIHRVAVQNGVTVVETENTVAVLNASITETTNNFRFSRNQNFLSIFS